MGRIGVQKEPSTCLFQIKFPYIERKWDKEEGKKAETWAGETWKQRRGKSQVRWNAEGREGMRGIGEERSWSWPAVGGGGVGSGGRRFPCCFNRDRKTESVPGQVLTLWPVPLGGMGLCRQSWSGRPDLGLMVPALSSASFCRCADIRRCSSIHCSGLFVNKSNL